jgi:hypothetical protein
MLGLFKGNKPALPGDVICMYHGDMVPAEDVRKLPPYFHSHVRRIPSSGGFVRNGYSWSLQFRRDPHFLKKQLAKPIAHREHCMPFSSTQKRRPRNMSVAQYDELVELWHLIRVVR